MSLQRKKWTELNARSLMSFRLMQVNALASGSSEWTTPTRESSERVRTWAALPARPRPPSPCRRAAPRAGRTTPRTCPALDSSPGSRPPPRGPPSTRTRRPPPLSRASTGTRSLCDSGPRRCRETWVQWALQLTENRNNAEFWYFRFE